MRNESKILSFEAYRIIKKYFFLQILKTILKKTIENILFLGIKPHITSNKVNQNIQNNST